MAKPVQRSKNAQTQRLAAALKSGSVAGAVAIGREILRLRKNNEPLPEILVKGLKSAYHSKYVNLALNLDESDLARAKENRLSLRGALRLLPLFNLAESDSLTASERKALRNEIKNLIASFSFERGKTKAWQTRADATVRKYSRSIESGSRGQFIHQRHRAITRALDDASREIDRLQALAPKRTQALASTLKEQIGSVRRQHLKLRELLRKDLTVLKTARRTNSTRDS